MRAPVALLLVVLSASLFAAPRRRAVDPPHVTVSEEIPLGVLTYGPTLAHHQRPRLASSGSESLAVWRTTNYGTSNGLYFVRLDATARPLEVPPLLLPVVRGAYDVVWDGREYVVHSESIVRIARDGTVISVRKPELGDGEMATAVALATHGEHIALLRSTSSSLDFFLLDRQDRVIRRTHLGSAARVVAIAAGNDGYLAAFSHPAGITLQQIAGDGATLGPRASLGGDWPDVAFVGDGFYIVWSELGVRGMRAFSSDVPVALPSPRNSAVGPQVAYDAHTGAVHVVWKEGLRIASNFFEWALHTARLDSPSPAVRVLDDVTESWSLGRGSVVAPELVPTERGLVAAWVDGPTYSHYLPPHTDIFATVIDGNDAAPAQRITARPPSQVSAGVAALAGSMAALWTEAGSVWASVNDRSFRIAAASNSGGSIATNGIDYFAAWLAEGDVRVTRIDRQGNLLGEPVTVGQSQYSGLLMACRAVDCLVTWPTLGGTEGRRISAQGTLIGSMPIVLPNASHITLAANDNEYLAVFSPSVGSNGTLRIVGDAVMPGPQLKYTLGMVVAPNGGGWLTATWLYNLQAIRISRVDANGAVVARYDLAAAWADAQALAWTGREYVLVVSRSSPTNGLRDTIAYRLDADGRPRSTAPDVIAGSGDDEVPAGIASALDGTAFIVYSRMATEHALATRLYMRRYSP